MEYDDSQEVTVKVKDKDLKCPVCGNGKFATRRSLMNTAGMTFMGFDWLNKEADNYICSDCGYVFWFLGSNRIKISAVNLKKNLPYGNDRQGTQ